MRSETASLRSMLKTTWVPAARPMLHLTESVTTTPFRSTVFACRLAARNRSSKLISGGSRRLSTAPSRRWFPSISPGQPTARPISTICCRSPTQRRRWLASADHIDQVQEALGRQLLLENPSTYLIFPESTMGETLFIAELVRRTGCGLLLDINNVFVSATNHGFAALIYLAVFPLEHVSEIHLAGHTEQADDEGELLLIDSHDRPVADAAWKLFDTVISQYGPIPTLVEWDSDLPDWPLLNAEADAAQAIIDRHAQGFMPGKAHAAR